MVIGSALAVAFGWPADGIWNFRELILLIVIGALAVWGAAAMWPRVRAGR